MVCSLRLAIPIAEDASEFDHRVAWPRKMAIKQKGATIGEERRLSGIRRERGASGGEMIQIK